MSGLRLSSKFQSSLVPLCKGGFRGIWRGWSRPGHVQAAQRGFSLIEQIVTIGLVAVIVPSMALLLSGLVRQASTSQAAVDMLILARSQIESIKQKPFRASYSLVSSIPDEYSIQVTVEPVKTYSYPAPNSTSTLPDEIQLVTVQVSCPDCEPPVGSLILQDYKVRR